MRRKPLTFETHCVDTDVNQYFCTSVRANSKRVHGLSYQHKLSCHRSTEHTFIRKNRETISHNFLSEYGVRYLRDVNGSALYWPI